MFLSIIIPMFNEESTIIQVLTQLLALDLSDYCTQIEYIVVDDSSKDDSFQIVSDFIHNFQQVKLLKQPENRGKGACIHLGVKNSNGDVYLVQDADLELSPADIPQILATMQKLKIDFVNGSRYLPGIARPLASYRRYLANKFFSVLISVLLNVRITDMACGYKLFTKKIYNKLNLQEMGFGFETELIIKALKYKKNNITEVPVQYFPRNAGEGKKLNNWHALYILKIIFKYGLF